MRLSNAANELSRSLSKPTPDALLDAIVMALEAVGDPSNRGKGGAAGYFKWFATKNPRAFLRLFIRALQLLPPQTKDEEFTLEAQQKRVQAIHQRLSCPPSDVIESSADQGDLDTTAPEASIGQNARHEGDARSQKDV